MERNWKKYWLIFKLSWQTVLEYRVDLFFNILRTSVIPFFMIFFWLALFKDKQEIVGFNYSSMFIYYLGVLLLYSNNSGYAAEFISNQIKNGTISNHLLKPLGYFNLVFFSIFSSDLFSFILRLIICILILTTLPFDFSLKSINILFFLLFLILGYLINFILNILISLTAFTMTENFMLRLSLNYLIRFFNGFMFPLSFFPVLLQRISNILPFKYQFYFPLMILLGKLNTTEIVAGGLGSILLLLIFNFFTKYLWEKSLRYYEAVGR